MIVAAAGGERCEGQSRITGWVVGRTVSMRHGRADLGREVQEWRIGCVGQSRSVFCCAVVSKANSSDGPRFPRAHASEDVCLLCEV